MEKVFITDKQGNKVLPKTHVSAVYDDEGNDLGSHLGAFEDEVRGLVDTPHQEYVTVATYTSLPASGSEDTIYRVSNYNGSTSQVDTTSYSEYAWDGSQYIFLCVKSQIDEVFDITAYNSNTKYADLSAALGVDGDNIPATLRRGGMSVKFVQSSDNKYVQFRLISNTWSTALNLWEEYIQEEKFYQLRQDALSFRADSETVGNIFDKETMSDGVLGYFIGDGGWGIDNNCAISSIIPVKENTCYVYHDVSGMGSAYFSVYDENGNTLTLLNLSGNPYRKYAVPSDIFKTPAGSVYGRVTTRINASTSFSNDISIYEGTEDVGYKPFDKKLLYSELPPELIAELDYKADLEKVILSRNLFDKTKIEQGWIGTGSDGGNVVHTDGEGQQVSNLIPVLPNTVYYITFGANLASKALRFVDESGNALKALTPSGTTLDWNIGESRAIKSPSNAKYVQFQVLLNYTGDPDETQFELGSTPTAHQEYQAEMLLPESELPISVQNLIGIKEENKHKLILDISSGGLSSVVSPFDATNNFKMTFYLNSNVYNRTFNWVGYYFVNKTTGVETLAKNADDDICPELLGGGMNYIGGGHGAYGLIQCTCSGHDKTFADIGSIWSNGTHNFTIISVESNYIYLISDNAEIYPNWYFYDAGSTDTFTHVSGAAHTQQFTISAASKGQWWPMAVTKFRRVYLDNKEILQSGEYVFNEMKIVENYDILNPASVLSKIQNAVGTFTANPLPTDFAETADVIFSHLITYTFQSALINFISTDVIYYQPISFDHFGFVQNIELPKGNGLKLYIPKAKSKNNGQDAVDFRTIVNASDGTGTIEGNDFENPTLPPDRQLHFNPDLAIMVGYLFDYGVGGNNRAAALVNHQAIYQSSAGRKMYPYGISGNTINAYDHYSAVCFKTFLNRSGINTGGVISKNVFEYNDKCYIYGDFNAAGIYEIEIPNKYQGRKVEVFEKRGNVELLTEIATNMIQVKVNSAEVMYGYIVAYIE